MHYFQGKIGAESEESYKTMGWSQQKVNQAVMLNKNMENLKSIAEQADSGLGADNSHFFMQKNPSSQEWKVELLWGPIASSKLVLPSSSLGKDRDLGSSFLFIKASKKVLGRSGSQQCGRFPSRSSAGWSRRELHQLLAPLSVFYLLYFKMGHGFNFPSRL